MHFVYHTNLIYASLLCKNISDKGFLDFFLFNQVLPQPLHRQCNMTVRSTEQSWNKYLHHANTYKR